MELAGTAEASSPWLHATDPAGRPFVAGFESVSTGAVGGRFNGGGGHAQSTSDPAGGFLAGFAANTRCRLTVSR
jgi:hypothetical protein